MSSPTASGAWPIPDLTTLGVFCAAPDVGDEECLTSLLAHIQQSTDSHLALMHFVCYDAPDWIMLRKVYPTSAYTHGPYRQGFDVPIGSEELPADRRSVPGWVASTRQPYCCGNVQDPVHVPSYLALDAQVAALSVVPVLWQQALVGLLSVASYHPDHYTADHLRSLLQVAASTAPRLAAIRAREVEAYRQRGALEDFAALSSESFTTSQDFLGAALKYLVRRTRAGGGEARIVEGNHLMLKASYRRDMPFTFCPPLGGAEIFLPIGLPEELAPEEHSFTGSVAATRRPQRTDNAQNGSASPPSVPTARRALVGAPICFQGQLLGTLVLQHLEHQVFLPEHEAYVATFAMLLASSLQGFLTYESPRLTQQTVRTALQETVRQIDTADEFATPQVCAALAHHIAVALRSDVCSLWLIHPLGPLVLRGVADLTLAPPTPPPLQQREAAVWPALCAAFGPLPRSFSVGQVAHPAAVAAEVLTTRTLHNYGPNRDALTFAQRHFQQPFLLAPLHTREGDLLGIMHVSGKERTRMNPQGVYTEADEHLLASLAIEFVDLYERQRLRETAEYAAQDLHDALGLITYDLLYGLDALRHAWRHQQADRVPALLRDCEVKAQSLHGEIRTVMGALRSHVLEEKGLLAAVQQYIKESVQRPGLQVSCTADDIDHLPLQLAWQLYRIIQEALTNVVKHARATEAHCALRLHPRYLTVHIYDNGCGGDSVLPSSDSGQGLRNLRRRVQGLGGRSRLRLSSRGTSLSVLIPHQGVLYVTPAP